MIKTLIVDDEPLARSAIRRLLADERDVEIVGEAADGAAAVAAIRDLRPDLVFLDVKMPALSGLEVIQRLTDRELPFIVFVTAFDRYAVPAFEAQALDYLLKPLTVPRFRAAVERARTAIARTERLDQHRKMLAVIRSLAVEGAITQPGVGRPVAPLERIKVHAADRVLWIETRTIDRIEADGNNVRLQVGSATHALRRTLSQLEAELDPAVFVRIHRTAIVNRGRIREIVHKGHGEYSVLLTDGTRLKLGRTYRHQLVSGP